MRMLRLLNLTVYQSAWKKTTMKYLRSKMFPKTLLLFVILSSFGYYNGVQGTEEIENSTAGNNNNNTVEGVQGAQETENNTANNNNNNNNNINNSNNNTDKAAHIALEISNNTANNNHNNKNDGYNSSEKKVSDEFKKIVTKSFSASDVSSHRHSGYSNLNNLLRFSIDTYDLFNRQCYLVFLVYVFNKQFKADTFSYSLDSQLVHERSPQLVASLEELHKYSLRILRVFNQDMKSMFSDKLWQLHSLITDFIKNGTPIADIIIIADDIIKRGQKFNIWHTEKEIDILMEYKYKPKYDHVIKGYNVCKTALEKLAGPTTDIETDLFEEYSKQSYDYSVTKDFGSVLFLMTKTQFDSLKDAKTKALQHNILFKTIEFAFIEALDVLIRKFYEIPDMKQINYGNLLHTSMLIILRSLYFNIVNFSQTLYLLSVTKGVTSILFFSKSYRKFVDLFQVKWLSIFEALDGWQVQTMTEDDAEKDKSVFIQNDKVGPSLIKYYSAFNDTWTDLLNDEKMNPTMLFFLEIHAWIRVFNHNASNMLIVARSLRDGDHTWSKGYIIGGLAACFRLLGTNKLLEDPPQENINENLWNSINKDKEFMYDYLYSKKKSEESSGDQ